MTSADPRRGAALRRVPAALVLLIGAVVLLRPLFRVPEDPVVAATPARGAVLTAAPPAVELAFGSRPRRGDAHVTVTAAAGQGLVRGGVPRDPRRRVRAQRRVRLRGRPPGGPAAAGGRRGGGARG
ncbi:copper resistance protein CopC, partial [Micromonospora sp. MH33]|uniref:copper resistance protein CopC n=1 Tax=Micromonospora sp. MH33 TaxID=1945509 RepID=UPI0011B21830